jgi:hypothetical protein
MIPVTSGATMIWYHTIRTLAPSLGLLFLVYTTREIEEVVPSYRIFLGLFAFIPLMVQFCLWSFRKAGRRPLHPYGLVLALSLPLVALLGPVAEWTARRFPSLCVTVGGEKVTTDRPGRNSSKAIFYVGIHGWGNPQSFEMNSASIHYSGVHGKFYDALNVELPGMRGFYTNSRPATFPVTQATVLDYVRRSDEFRPGQAETIAAELWEILNRYAEKRGLPPMVDRFYESDEPRIVYYVRPDTRSLASCLLALPLLAIISWGLSLWYVRRVRSLELHRTQHLEPIA